MTRRKMTTDTYRTEPGEWVVGASLYRTRARDQWVVNLELGRRVVTVYVERAL